MYAKIKPVNILKDTATILLCNSIVVNSIGNSGFAKVYWQLVSSEGVFLQNNCSQVEPNEYLSWGQDDSYILRLVASKLNLEITEIINDNYSFGKIS